MVLYWTPSLVLGVLSSPSVFACFQESSMIPVHNEDSPVPARSFCRTDWTKPKSVTKPYSEVRQESTPGTRKDAPAGLGTLRAEINYDAGCKIPTNQAPNHDVLLASETQIEELKSNAAFNYSTTYPTATYNGSKLHITTGSSKYDEDKLVQKIEDIEEVPLVEAEPRTDINKPQKSLGPSVMPCTDISWLRSETIFIDELSNCLLTSMPFSKYQNRDIKIDPILLMKNVDDGFNEENARLVNNAEDKTELELQPEGTLEANQAAKVNKMPITDAANDAAKKPDLENDEGFEDRFYEEDSILIINNAKGRPYYEHPMHEYPLSNDRKLGERNRPEGDYPHYDYEYKLPKFKSESETNPEVNEPAKNTKKPEMIKEFHMLIDDYKLWLFKPLLLLSNLHMRLVDQRATDTEFVFPYPTAAMNPCLLMSDHNRNDKFNLEDSTLIVNNYQPKMKPGQEVPKFKSKNKKRINRQELKKPMRSNMQFKLLTLSEHQFNDAQPSLDAPNLTHDVMSCHVVSGSSLFQRVCEQNDLLFCTKKELQASKKKSHCPPPSPHHYPHISRGTVTGTPKELDRAPPALPRNLPPSKKKKECQNTTIDNPVTMPQMGASLLPARTLLPLLVFTSALQVAASVSNICNARAVLTEVINEFLGCPSFEGTAPMKAMDILEIDEENRMP